jgi:hypothetical protein
VSFCSLGRRNLFAALGLRIRPTMTRENVVVIGRLHNLFRSRFTRIIPAHQMVDVPASPLTELPNQRLARSETTSGRLVQVLQDSSSRLFARKNTRETVSAHALERTVSPKSLTSPPWHGDCCHSSQAGAPRCFGVWIHQRFLSFSACC